MVLRLTWLAQAVEVDAADESQLMMDSTTFFQTFGYSRDTNVDDTMVIEETALLEMLLPRLASPRY